MFSPGFCQFVFGPFNGLIHPVHNKPHVSTAETSNTAPACPLLFHFSYCKLPVTAVTECKKTPQPPITEGHRNPGYLGALQMRQHHQEAHALVHLFKGGGGVVAQNRRRAFGSVDGGWQPGKPPTRSSCCRSLTDRCPVTNRHRRSTRPTTDHGRPGQNNRGA